MIILAVTTIILLTCLYICIKNEWDYDCFGWQILLTFSVVVFACLILAIPLHRSNDGSFIAQYESVRATIRDQRANDSVSELERATLTREIIEDNAHLASKKYWNNTQWDWWIDDRAANLSPIK